MADQRGSEPKARIEAVVDDAFGFDFKLPRTVKDLLLRPGLVADAALAGDHSRYMRPLRLFLALFGLQALAAGFAGMNDFNPLTDEYANNPAAIAILQERLAAVGSSLERADEVAKNWAQWSNWPLTILSSALFALVVWALRPALGFYRSTMLYLVATNACSVLSLPLFFAAALFHAAALPLALAAGVLMLVAFVVYMGLLFHRRAADTALGLGVRIVLIALGWIPVGLIVGLLAIGLLDAAFRLQIGVSYQELLAAAEAASTP